MMGNMKIGIFDSGLGGLLITKAIRDHLPEYDIVYYGDTLNVPYGNRSSGAIYTHTKNAMDFLFEEQNCALVIMACNTANASALQLLQQTYLADRYLDRRILGVVVPTLETAHDKKHTRIGLLATHRLVDSCVYEEELYKINPDIQLFSEACPLLVPLIENDGLKWINPILEEYVRPLIEKNVQSIILGCTHYPLLKGRLQKLLHSRNIDIISQDEIVPYKLDDYLFRHEEIEVRLSRAGTTEFIVSDLTDAYKKTANVIYSQNIDVRLRVA
jgi:glutamate racemase